MSCLEYEPHLVKVKHEVEFAYVLECSVKRFYKDLVHKSGLKRPKRRVKKLGYLYEVQDTKFTFRSVHHKHEVQRCVIPVHNPQLLSICILLIEETLELRCIKEVTKSR